MQANSIAQAVLFSSLLIVAAVWDIQKRIIPDIICFSVAAVGLLSFQPAKLLGLLVVLPFLISATICNGGIGGGDIKLAAASGLVLGLPTGIFGIIIGLSLLLVYHLSRKTPEKWYPLAPFLSTGFVAAFLIG